jgi:hypothetical protein
VLSRLLVPALLRPLGEHLLAMLRPEPGDLCVELGGTAGVMPVLLARRSRECVVVADDPEVLGEVRDEAAMLHLDNVIPVLSRGDALSMPDGIVQVATSLFVPLTAETLDELLRVLDPRRGRLACAVRVELPGVTLGGEVPDVPADRLRLVGIRDVARFDGEQHYRAATGAPETVRLDAVAAVDGTIRIPVEAAVLTRLPG